MKVIGQERETNWKSLLTKQILNGVLTIRKLTFRITNQALLESGPLASRPVLPVTPCVALDNSFNLSGHQFSHIGRISLGGFLLLFNKL